MCEPRASQAFTAATSSSPKKDSGLQPILDLRHLNHALMKRSFSMITLKQILSQICLGDWFMSLDLKDAYFHIQIAPHHRWFLRFAFEGVAYQYQVVPFGLSLAPRTFTRCMDAALSPPSRKAPPIRSKLSRRCWALWQRLRQFFSWVCFVCNPSSSGWNRGFQQQLGEFFFIR